MYSGVFTNLDLARFFVFCVSVKFKLAVPLLGLCAFCLERPSLKWSILASCVSDRTLNPTHSLTHFFNRCSTCRI